jgi:hypothetical protein
VSNERLSPIDVLRYEEQLRQESLIFDERMKQDKRWFLLRLIMGYSCVAILLLVAVVTIYILLNYSLYSGEVVAAAAVALFSDIVGLAISVYKIVVNPDARTRLEPVTQVPLSEVASIRAAGGLTIPEHSGQTPPSS